MFPRSPIAWLAIAHSLQGGRRGRDNVAAIRLARQIEEIYCLLIPMWQLRLIVPRTCVAEVIRYSAPEKPCRSPACPMR